VSSVVQLVPLPVPSYQPPSDLPIEFAFKNSSWEAWLAEHGTDVRAVVTHSLHGLPRELWECLPSLELIANFGVGLERIDLRMAGDRGVRVTYTPNLLTKDVADLAITFLLALSRRLVAGDAYVRAGMWGKEPFAPGHSLSGHRLGILGLGRIGKAIATRAKAFDMQIGYHSRTPGTDAHTWFDSAITLAEWADVLVAALPGGEATNHLVDGPVLKALGPSGVFINVARGSVVDEHALLAALRAGSIAAAGLDVYDEEPNDGQPFRNLANVILTPHVGSLTIETRTAMANSVYGNVRALLSGYPLQDAVAFS
jgi:hydroxypyruvate reductase